MPKSLVFPYGITLREGGILETFPAAEVQFQSKEGEWLSLFLLIDSGGFISALPKTDAPVFGVEIERGLPIFISGISGEATKGWRHELSVKLGNEIITAPFVFLESAFAPRILGREMFFERFTIIFEEARRRSAFLDKDFRHAKSVKKIIDKI